MDFGTKGLCPGGLCARYFDPRKLHGTKLQVFDKPKAGHAHRQKMSHFLHKLEILLAERTCEANPADENSSFIFIVSSNLFHFIISSLPE